MFQQHGINIVITNGYDKGLAWVYIFFRLGPVSMYLGAFGMMGWNDDNRVYRKSLLLIIAMETVRHAR